MIDLVAVNRAETFERIRDPLANRDIRLHHVPVTERTLALTDDAARRDEFDVGFVYPGRFMEGGVADALFDIPWINGREAVVTSRNKGGVIARLDAAGVPVPKTVMVSNPVGQDELTDVFERFEPPVVVKPNSATRGVGVAKVHDLDSFLGVVDYLDLVHDYRATGDKSFLVQEYVAGATDYRAMIVDGEYVGAVERRLPDDALRSGQWKHNVHRGADATGVDLPNHLRELAARVAAELDIPLLGVDLLVSEDRAVVSETNARPTVDAATKYEEGFYDRLAMLIEQVAKE
ncbi:ATP-grasp domain-containing protein [Natranaeroarchaeum aerophilus]|uniref:RimK family alpha-L-glutamate ligase n=1 Tax=Natranaeroarchaeum aerophilus TaxID=2917711 RepID=A0AAE3FP47_9EURY|nr:RimK family alpha-L-glutamate ligase [Natranaeroarchaeum aerophilus]MCL9813032.1 RimK family alpha-L-glutamate ligase [Natranaeroarchaeum aerophilus]